MKDMEVLFSESEAAGKLFGIMADHNLSGKECESLRRICMCLLAQDKGYTLWGMPYDEAMIVFTEIGPDTPHYRSKKEELRKMYSEEELKELVDLYERKFF